MPTAVIALLLLAMLCACAQQPHFAPLTSAYATQHERQELTRLLFE